MQKLAYLGMGIMGRGMARNLIEAGYDVTVWNRSPEKCEPLVEAGATQAATPAEATEGADAVLYCLANHEAVEAVVFGDDGVLGAIQDGQVAVDMSTVHPDLSRREAEAYSDRNVAFLDAPVFGSKEESREGGLWIVVGGASDTLETMRPVLEAMSATIHHMGEENGAGTSMKLAGNLLVSSMLMALSESLVLSKKAGLDPKKVLDVIRVVDFRSPLFDAMGESMTERDFEVFFALRHMLKDANLIQHLAEDLNAPVPSASVTRETLKAAVNQGWGDENASAIVKALELEAGTSLNGST